MRAIELIQLLEQKYLSGRVEQNDSLKKVILIKSNGEGDYIFDYAGEEDNQIRNYKRVQKGDRVVFIPQEGSLRKTALSPNFYGAKEDNHLFRNDYSVDSKKMGFR